MKILPAIPKSDTAVKNDFEDCIKRERLIGADADTYAEYLERAKDDFVSAKRDFDSKDHYWCLIKAYQSVFFACNAFLVKKYKFFSKDHKCLISALLNYGIDEKISEKIKKLLELNSRMEKVDVIRQKRNTALYHPKAKNMISEANASEILNDCREIIGFFIEVLE